MSNGWKLSVALISKQFGKLGDSFAEAIANFDPETATEADRDALALKLRGFAGELVKARNSYNKEKKEADDLTALIDSDSKASEILIAKFEAGEIDETTLNSFADEVEENKARLVQEIQEAADAKELVDAFDELFKTVEKQLADFDAAAKKALSTLARAKADQAAQDANAERLATLANLKSGLKDSSTALGALGRKAQKIQESADTTRLLNESGQKTVDKANVVADARKLAAGVSTKPMSAVERLRANMPKPE